ncbi:unnamed protein product [Diamesa tonsa]
MSSKPAKLKTNSNFDDITSTGIINNGCKDQQYYEIKIQHLEKQIRDLKQEADKHGDVNKELNLQLKPSNKLNLNANELRRSSAKDESSNFYDWLTSIVGEDEIYIDQKDKLQDDDIFMINLPIVVDADNLSENNNNDEFFRGMIVCSDKNILQISNVETGTLYCFNQSKDFILTPKQLLSFKYVAIPCALAITQRTRSMSMVLLKKYANSKTKISYVADYVLNMKDNVIIIRGNSKVLEFTPAGLCRISHIKSTAEFYIQLENDIFKLRDINEDLNRNMNNFVTTEVKTGQICVVMNPTNDEWQRAQIISFDENGIKVKLIDYGNNIVVQQVYSTSNSLLLQQPPVAQKCCLKTSRTVGKFTTIAEEKFLEMTYIKGGGLMNVNMLSMGSLNLVELSYSSCSILNNMIDPSNKQQKISDFNNNWNTLQVSPKRIDKSQETSMHDSMFSSSLESSESDNELLVPFNTIYKTSNIKSKIDYNVNFVSWISPYEFYVRMKNDKDAFDLQTEELEQSYKNDVPLNVNVKLEKYNMVAACSNGQYYRGEVIDVIENGRKFIIGCVDTGEVKVLSHKDLYKMEKHFTLNARLCVKCSFDNVLCNGFYSSDSIHKILDNTKMYTISFQDNSFSSEHSHLPSNVVQKFEIGNKNARNLLIQCKVIKEVPDNFDIYFLKDQIIRFNIVAVGESDELLCQPENSDLMFLASLPRKLEYEQLKVFKTKYEGQQLVAKIHDVFEFNNKLNITPYIDMFTKEPAPQTTVPILNKVFTGWISHIQSLNCAYFHLKEWHEEFPKRLEILFAFYEENNRPALRQYKKGTLCAGKGKDGNWYRCQIVSEQVQKGLCEVQYLDYGNTEFIVAETLMELDQRFIDNSNLAIKIFYAISNTKKCNVKDLITEMKELIADEVECNVEEFYDGGVIVDVIHTRSNKNLFQNLINEEMAANVSIDELKNYLIESIHMNSAAEDTKVDCEIAAFTSPTDFYIRPESYVSKYEQMKQDIQLIALAIKPLSCFDENTLCLACDPYNHEWHRAKIIDSDGEIITVRCTDSGFTYTLVDKHDLKQLPEELAKFQPFAIRSSLAIKLNPKYEECATNEMKEFIAKKMKFKFEFITDVCTKFVDLYCDDLNLAEEFVKQKYAQLMEVVPAGKCYISHVNSLLDFYIQLEKDTLLLQHISDYLADNVKKLLPMEDFKEGSMCAAMYTEDSEWYRAVIEYHNENGTGVKFIDFGNDCFVQKVCAISDEITAIPPMAKKVCIMKPPMIQEYSVEAEEKFQEIAALGETVMDVKMIAPGEFASVELRIEGKNINDTLIPLCLNN